MKNLDFEFLDSALGTEIFVVVKLNSGQCKSVSFEARDLIFYLSTNNTQMHNL